MMATMGGVGDATGVVIFAEQYNVVVVVVVVVKFLTRGHLYIF